jgi:hypothetical protein
MADVFGGVVPEYYFPVLISDPRFKDNRNLMNYLMTPASLT